MTTQVEGNLTQLFEEDDPGLYAQATGVTGWALVLGIGDGDGFVLDYDARNSGLEWSIDGCGRRFSECLIDYDPGEDLVFLWLEGACYGEDLEFLTFDEQVLIEGAGKGLEEEEADEIDSQTKWPEIYPLHVGLTFGNCSHSIKEPASKVNREIRWGEPKRFGWRCMLCGLEANRKNATEWLREIVLRRHQEVGA